MKYLLNGLGAGLILLGLSSLVIVSLFTWGVWVTVVWFAGLFGLWSWIVNKLWS